MSGVSDLFLTEPDLRRLTGLKRPSAQIRWLQERGWPHEVDCAGRPVVARAEMERRMTGLAPARTPEPDWSALSR